jgi:hypothetical protein
MSAPKHTPGPWNVSFCDDDEVRSDDGRLLCVTVPLGFDVEEKANARLIAAAPELLAALQEIYRMGMSEFQHSGHMIARCKGIAFEAIARAGGAE